MKSVTFLLAMEASLADGLFNVTGGAVNIVRVTGFPVAMHLKAVFQIDLAPSEIWVQHDLRLVLRDAQGETVDWAEGSIGPKGPSPWPSGHIIVNNNVNLDRWHTPAPGYYSVALYSGDDKLASVEIRVEVVQDSELP